MNAQGPPADPDGPCALVFENGRGSRIRTRQENPGHEIRAGVTKARANLKRLAAMARHVPNRQQAEETVRKLLDWYEHQPD